MAEFTTIVGIDQTGAARRRGTAACALPVCFGGMIEPNRWKLTAVRADGRGRLRLGSLSPDAVGEMAAAAGGEFTASRSAIVVDAVLGVPHMVGYQGFESLQALMQRTREYPGYGMGVGERFFRDLLSEAERAGSWLPPSQKPLLPLRECDRLAGANSVFSPKPFQRNVQTGTFRIWKDLASWDSGHWFNLWPFADPEASSEDRAWLFEGYPGLMRRGIFGVRARGADALSLATAQLCETIAIEVDSPSVDLIRRDRNIEDAALLVLGTIRLIENNCLWEPWEGFRHSSLAASEGWIAGLKSPAAELHHEPGLSREAQPAG